MYDDMKPELLEMLEPDEREMAVSILEYRRIFGKKREFDNYSPQFILDTLRKLAEALQELKYNRTTFSRLEEQARVADRLHTCHRAQLASEAKATSYARHERDKLTSEVKYLQDAYNCGKCTPCMYHDPAYQHEKKSEEEE